MHTGDRISLLETFVHIAEAGTLRRAAVAMGVSQPTVSRRLRELEALLGAKLASRSTSHFALTDEGMVILAEARQLRDQWQSMQQRLGGRHHSPEGTLRIIAPSAYGTTFLTDVVCAMAQKHPRLRVELTLAENVSDQTISQADCWVMVGENRNKELVNIRLGTMERLIIGAPALVERHAVRSPRDLDAVPWVGLLPYFDGAIEVYEQGVNRYRYTPVSPLKTDSLLSAYRAILNGVGIGTAAPWMCLDDIDRGRLVRVLPDWALQPIPINIALPPGIYRPARVSAFISELRVRMAALPGFAASV